MTQKQDDDVTQIAQAIELNEKLMMNRPGDAVARELGHFLPKSQEHVRRILMQPALDEVLRLTRITSQRTAHEWVAFGLSEPLESTERPFEIAEPAVSVHRSVWHWRAPRVRALAAGVVGVVILAVGAAGWRAWAGWTDYRTASEMREVTLDDGSVMNVYADSLLRVRYSSELRAVQLEHGGARFRVRHEPARAFRVKVEGGMLEVAGTDFSVLRKGPETEISVAEGLVNVTGQKEEDAPVQLPAGYVTQMSTEGHVEPARLMESAADSAVQPTRLRFENATIAELATAFEAQNPGLKIIVDDSVRGLRFGGAVNPDDPQTWIRALESYDEVRAEVRGETIWIRGKARGER